jgi:hypothetical protein
VGRGDRSAGRGEELLEQLALRTARRQRANLRVVHVDDVQRAVHDRRHRPSHLALRSLARQGSAGRPAGARPTRRDS